MMIRSPRRLLAGILVAAASGTLLANPAAPQACALPPGWSMPGGSGPRPLASAELLAQMARRDVVLLGERHDEAEHHRWQLHVLAGLWAIRPDMVIGFEMFPRRLQPVLDRWIAGELDEKTFLAETDWKKVWGYPAEYYLPLFHFARQNGIPMRALNVERDRVKAVSAGDPKDAATQERDPVGKPAPATAAYRAFLKAVFDSHGPMGKQAGDGAVFERFVDAQLLWDRAMAEGLAQAPANANARARVLTVGIIGSGHLLHGFGVPHQLRALGVEGVGVLLPESAGRECSELPAGYADAVFGLPALPGPAVPQPRLGVTLESAGNEVRIAAVGSDSLAERSGLRIGDLIVTLAGAPLKEAAGLVEAVRMQPGGTWLPMQVRRGAELIEVVVKFPTQE